MLLAAAVALSVLTHPLSPVSPKDSAAMVNHARDAEFHFLLDWRHEAERWMMSPGWQDLWLQAFGTVERDVFAGPPIPMNCAGLPIPRGDDQQRTLSAHLLVAPVREPTMSECPRWASQQALQLPRAGPDPDLMLTDTVRLRVRGRRDTLIHLLDSIALRIPGDPWLIGQRVRMQLAQADLPAATHVANECRAAAWWCEVLRGYVAFQGGNHRLSAAAFDSARHTMPRDTLCAWENIAPLLLYSARRAYDKLSCAQQTSLNEKIWWLATPLFATGDNPRRLEQMARRVQASLDEANDVDEWEDVRYNYTGPSLFEMVQRYGWPSAFWWVRHPGCRMQGVPPGWGRFDIRGTYIGPTCWPAYLNHSLPEHPTPLYRGPQYHLIPEWSAIQDPLHSTPADWDIGPKQLSATTFQQSWWPAEFYDRREGPLVSLPSQIAFFRRTQSTLLASAAEWDPNRNFIPAPHKATFAVTTSGGPNERPVRFGSALDATYTGAMITPIESRPLLLAIEIVATGVAPAGRTRFGVNPPPPLSTHETAISISDLVLLQANADPAPPASLQDMLAHMLGTTDLVNPTRVGFFWEVYGQADADTVDVQLQIIRPDSSGALARAAAEVGVGHVGSDSVGIRWREPRRDDPPATLDSGMTIRPRGAIVDLSGLAAGSYVANVIITHRGRGIAAHPRFFTVTRIRTR